MLDVKNKPNIVCFPPSLSLSKSFSLLSYPWFPSRFKRRWLPYCDRSRNTTLMFKGIKKSSWQQWHMLPVNCSTGSFPAVLKHGLILHAFLQSSMKCQMCWYKSGIESDQKQNKKTPQTLIKTMLFLLPNSFCIQIMFCDLPILVVH